MASDLPSGTGDVLNSTGQASFLKPLITDQLSITGDVLKKKNNGRYLAFLTVSMVKL